MTIIVRSNSALAAVKAAVVVLGTVAMAPTAIGGTRLEHRASSATALLASGRLHRNAARICSRTLGWASKLPILALAEARFAAEILVGS